MATATAVTAPNVTPTVVQSSIVAPETSLSVRFLPVIGGSSISPVARALVALPGPMKGLVMEAPIFLKNGTYSVALPGGRFSSLKAANKVNANGEALLEQDADGLRKVAAFPGAILTAFHAWKTTDKADQTINLS